MSAENEAVQTQCLWVDKNDDGVSRSVETRNLPADSGDRVRIRVEYSSLNYKDALCSSGHPGVAKSLPIIPGIDAAGTVVVDPSGTFDAGTQVMIFHAEFGTQQNGGWSEYVDVPVDWVYRLPDGLTTKQSMTLGTAGFTAAQCVDELIKHDISPEAGEVVVTGSTGGVGVCAVKLLSRLGYRVVAVTGKSEKASWLRELGADEVIGRDAVDDATDRPLLGGRWAGAVDTVGGNILATVLRTTKPRGCVTACGLVGGVDLPITVYPFILRGVTLQGVDTAGISREYRSSLWGKLAGQWALSDLDSLVIDTTLQDIEEKIESILAGQIAGRVVVKI